MGNNEAAEMNQNLGEEGGGQAYRAVSVVAAERGCRHRRRCCHPSPAGPAGGKGASLADPGGAPVVRRRGGWRRRASAPAGCGVSSQALELVDGVEEVEAEAAMWWRAASPRGAAVEKRDARDLCSLDGSAGRG